MDLTQRLKDKVAVITGGASGIGLATAKRMRAEGAIVVIGDIDPATGKSVANDLNVTFVQVDVSDQVAVDHLFDTAVEVHGSVDIAFNNAGISPPEDDLIEITGIDAWDRVQDINLKSVFFCCKAALRHMVPAQKGSIVNTASFVAVNGSATSQISYTASKGGVLAMSREVGYSVCAARHSGQRAVPRPGEHAAATRAVRQGSRAGGAPVGARADGPVRRTRRTRRRGDVPRQRRRVLHHRVHVPRRRWHHRPLRHAAVDPAPGLSTP